MYDLDYLAKEKRLKEMISLCKICGNRIHSDDRCIKSGCCVQEYINFNAKRPEPIEIKE
jgi:hypothetical protein